METPAEYAIEDIVRIVPFGGFSPPTANYSKMPHQLVDALPLVTSLSEMKVILYVLRHTWGFQDDEKRISLDEFRNGRKHTRRYLKRHPGAAPRLDSGTGMSINAIKNGIKRAVKHGFLSVDEDDSDKARIKRWYRLSDSDCQELTPDRQELIPRGSEVDSRSKKETLIETTEREEPPLADSPPVVDSLTADTDLRDTNTERLQRIRQCADPDGAMEYYEDGPTVEDSPDDDPDLLYDCPIPRMPPISRTTVRVRATVVDDDPDIAETAAMFHAPPASQEPPEKRTARMRHELGTDPFQVAAVVEEKRAGVKHPDMGDARHDIHPWCNSPVSAWCAIAEKSYAEMTVPTRIKLGGIFYKVGADVSATPLQVAAAIARFPGEHKFWTEKVGYEWPSDNFCNKLGMMLVPDVEPEPPPKFTLVEPDWLGVTT